MRDAVIIDAGHQLGASRARITATLLHAMLARDASWALQTICEAGAITRPSSNDSE